MHDYYLGEPFASIWMGRTRTWFACPGAMNTQQHTCNPTLVKERKRQGRIRATTLHLAPQIGRLGSSVDRKLYGLSARDEKMAHSKRLGANMSRVGGGCWFPMSSLSNPIGTYLLRYICRYGGCPVELERTLQRSLSYVQDTAMYLRTLSL